VHAAALGINAREVIPPGISGPEVGKMLRQARIQAIAQVQ